MAEPSDPDNVPRPQDPPDALGRVFISYASQDAPAAQKVCSALETAGFACWIAPRDVRPGESYAAAIVNAINSCRTLVLMLSRGAIDSPHVLREVERASSKRRPVLSIRMDATELPPELEYFLSANQWLDASGGSVDEILPALIASVGGRDAGKAVREATRAGIPGGPRAADPTASTAPGSAAAGRGTRTAAILIAVAVVAGFAYLLADKFWLSKRAVTEPSLAPVGSSAAPAAAAVSEKSIAVLPFTDMSEKKDQEYFSDGLSEELIDLLTKIPELHVPARTSSFYFKGKSEDIPTISQRLRVAHVLEGSVRKSGNHMRVTAQLVRADNGYHLWSETYDRNLDDIFKVQDDIAGAVVKALKVSLLQGDAPRVAPTANSEAYTLYLRAVALAKTGAPADTVQAREYLLQALKLDPQFALGWAELSDVYTDDTVDWNSVFAPKDQRISSSNDPGRPSGTYSDDGLPTDWHRAAKERVVDEAHDAAANALKYGPNLAAAHLAMARVRLFVDWDWAAAESELDKARELEPDNAHILQQAASLAITLGQLQKAIDCAQRAIMQDPLGTASNELAKASYRIGALPQAENAYRQLVELYPTASAFHYRYGLVLLARGHQQAALDEIGRDIPPYRQVGLPLALDALGRRADADRELALAEQKWGPGMSYQISYVYASRNQPDRAMDWLEHAYQMHDAGLISMLHDPMLKSLETNSRFQALLRKMKLSQ
jgi:TolB-like protein